MTNILPEGPALGPSIETLLDRAFGPGRTAKVSYRYRQGVAPLPELCFTAFTDGALSGTVRHWPVTLSGGHGLGLGGTGLAPALSVVLLGPIAVDPALRIGGIGGRLMRHAIVEAAAGGVDMIVLVGDPAYYRRFGFRAASAFGIVMPEENAARVQALPLTARANALRDGGLVLPANGLVRPVCLRLALAA
ncbi:GNAT family N-acetyltransferase [Rhodospirillum rubrum]|uniref:GNAT family N-acetyltransferase n=1 Tax=Rhodospirillum rubrum TaxID=1085 RepID=UPI001907E371|nr:N-acetyltransferase [Rhodospirillum rubrum]MBK1663822.1 GNAT family N-acetyltransferase [Rhodospirillum rubrum]MBK1675839.1 GNAT family N-acetyltransferase [Rhodospirillum rubrum]